MCRHVNAEIVRHLPSVFRFWCRDFYRSPTECARTAVELTTPEAEADVGHRKERGVALAPRLISSAMLVLVAAGVAQARAQVAGTGVIDGIVTNANLVPLGGAIASVAGTTLHVTTTRNGRFRMLGLPAGTYEIVVQRLGFAPASAELEVPAGDTVRTAFALELAGTMLDTLVVTAQRRSARMTEFDERRRMRIGQSLNETEIDRRNVTTVTDLLYGFLAVNVDGGVTNRRGDSVLRPCPMQFFVDGVHLASRRLDDLPSPKELAGIEVFTSIASVPPQYATFDGGGTCGVILFWTKDGT
jgi:hypothetical protein